MRQFFGPQSTIQMDIGDIDVQLISNIAIASYAFRFQGTEVKSDGRTVSHEIPVGRGTQVFKLDDGGQLRILHEHFSSGEPAKEATVEI